VNLEGQESPLTGGSSGIGLAVAAKLLSKGRERSRSAAADRTFWRLAVRELGGPGAQVASVAADVATAHGRAVTLATCGWRPCGSLA